MLLAQSPAFDVASVKVNQDVRRGLGQIQYSGDTLTARGIALWWVVKWAYGVQNSQIAGGDAMQDPPFLDIEAKTSGPVPEAQLRLMMRTLLAQRFHLAVHEEKRELPVTALLVAKGGPKFHESDGKYDPARGAEMPLFFLQQENGTRMQRNTESGDRIRDSFTNITMPLFARVVELMVSRSPYDKSPVVDMTGLRGRYDLFMVREIAHDGAEGTGPQTSDDLLAQKKALFEKELGLTLASRKATIDVLVIDHVDKAPAEN
jgi:uncharacterized protein (TIGR03435 family)